MGANLFRVSEGLAAGKVEEHWIDILSALFIVDYPAESRNCSSVDYSLHSWSTDSYLSNSRTYHINRAVSNPRMPLYEQKRYPSVLNNP